MAVIAREMARTSPDRTLAAQSCTEMLIKRRVLVANRRLHEAWLYYFAPRDLRASPNHLPRAVTPGGNRTAKSQGTPVPSGYSAIQKRNSH